jgi:hypothetical protein
MADRPVNNTASPAPSAAEHRGWSVKMIAWSAALAAFLLLAAWGAANWRVFHLAYCKHLLRSGDPAKVAKALRLIPKFDHVRVGMTYQEVCKIMWPLEPVEMRTKTTGRFTADGQVFPGTILGPVRNPNRLSFINPRFDPPLEPGQVGYVDEYAPPRESGAWTVLRIAFRDDKVFTMEVEEPL